MKVLVTGGAGFIGSNIVELLVENNFDVVVLDNFSLGSMENLAAVKDKVKVIQGDVEDIRCVRDASKGCDIICHQAAASASPMFKKDLKKCYSVNINGTINALQAAVENSVKRVLVASTSSLYGNLPAPHREDAYTKPPNFYSATKMAKEHLAYLFSQEYGIETVVFRYMSVYGPHERSKGSFANLASQFLWSMTDGKSPVVYQDGNQTRDFVYVKDVARANLLAIEHKGKIEGDIFNVGTGRVYTINDLIGIINDILKKNIKATYIEHNVKNYIRLQMADISNIRSVLGFEPQYDLRQGLEELIRLGA